MLTYAEITKTVASELDIARRLPIDARSRAHAVAAIGHLAIAMFDVAKKSDPALDYNTFCVDCDISFVGNDGI